MSLLLLLETGAGVMTLLSDGVGDAEVTEGR